MKITTIGLDIAKQVFQVHGADKMGHKDDMFPVIVEGQLSTDIALFTMAQDVTKSSSRDL